MKQYIKVASVIICAALALAGCSKTEEFQYNPDSMLQIASVSGISPFGLMQEPASKAVITGDSLPGDEAAKGIGLFVTAEDGSAYDGHDSGYANVKYTFNGSKWSTQTPIYLSGSDGKLYGYFPYNPEANDFRAIPVESSLNGMDYLYADTKDVNHMNKTVDLQMNHALSRLHLTIKKGANFTASAPLSKITLTSTAIDATGTMDLTTGTITAAKKSGENGTVELATDGEITAEGIVMDILLVPADNSEGKKGISISLLIAGKPAGITIPAENGLDIRSGIQNDVTLTIEDTGIKVTGVGIGVWGEGGSRQVQVGAHTVTVKLADYVTPHDIITDIYVDGNAVKIEACSKFRRILDVNISGNNSYTQAFADRIFTYTISSIVSDVDVILGYTNDPVFSVSKDGGKTINLVYFSKSNLWADVSNTLHFETNPWDFNENYNTNHVSHFTWSSTVANAVGKSNSGNYLFCDENHKVSVDGSDKIYYALSIEEWDYLLNTREMRSVGIRYSFATLGGKQGLIIYPDEYSGRALDYEVTNLPENVIFLPCTGRRNGTDIYDSKQGFYVSSSIASTGNIYRVFFGETSGGNYSLNVMNTTSPHAGSAVRLVTGYESGPSSRALARRPQAK